MPVVLSQTFLRHSLGLVDTGSNLSVIKKYVWVLNVNAILSFLEMPFYAVAVGKVPGIYTTWPQCQSQIKGYPKAKFKKFNTEAEATSYVQTNGTETQSLKSYNTNASSTALQVENTKPPAMKAVGKYGSQTLLKQDKISSIAEKLDSFIEETNRKLNEFNNKLESLESKFYSSVSSNISPTSENKRKNETVTEYNNEQTKKRRTLVTIEVLEDGPQSTNDTTSQSTRSKTLLSNETDTVEEVDSPWLGGHRDNFIVGVDGYVIVYTDGACTNNGRKGAKAGVGVWFNHNNPYNVAAPVHGPATNNNAEIQAATRAIEQAHLAGIKRLNIYTDSQFMISCITEWIKKWKRNNWMTSAGAPVKNKDQLVILDNAIQTMEAVKWTHIRGHVGIEGNECADALARSGAAMY